MPESKAARGVPQSKIYQSGARRTALQKGETYLPKFGGFFRHHVNTEKNEMKTTHAYFGWLFGTAHTAYHWGALLECGTRVPLLIKATRVAESYRDFVIGYQGLM